MKKRFLSLFLVLAMIVSMLPTSVMTAFAADTVVDSGITGDCTWTLIQNNDDAENPTYTLTISGNGAMANYVFGSNIPWDGYRGKITKAVIENGVTSIGNYAFNSCSSLTSVVIPDSVTSIEGFAFYYCLSLTSVEIPNSVTSIGEDAFAWSGLTSVEIPNSVTSIETYAFYECSSLTSVEIPNSVTSIGSSAFNRCSSLTSIVIPNSVTSVGESAFDTCTSLTSVEIPDSVTSIGDGAFSGCSSLTSVEIPDSVTSIGEWAFAWSGLTSIEIPNSVTSIGNSAFYACSNLSEIYFLGTEAPEIGTYAFRYIPATTVNVPCNYDGDTFGGIPVTKPDHAWENGVCANCGESTIPDVATFKGGSLRVLKNYDTADIRFRYIIDANLPEGAEITSWYWNYGLSEDNLCYKVEGTNVEEVNGQKISNILFTGIKAENYKDNLYTQLVVEYELNGVTYTSIDDQICARNIYQIATAVVLDDTATESAKTYAQGLLDYYAENVSEQPEEEK